MPLTIKRHLASYTIALIIMSFIAPGFSSALSMKTIESGIGQNDALLVTSQKGEIIASKNENTPLVPASTLKILTSLCAIHYLGEDYRFPVKFHIRDKKDLVIEGFGDPLLVSEVIEKYCKDVSGILASKGIKNIRNIIMDDSYFAHPITIPGATLISGQPYDAPVGAISVNFNSVSFKTVSGKLVSPEPQTPLTTTAIAVAKQSGLKAGRIPLPPNKGMINRYSGEVFRHFMKKAGIDTAGVILEGQKKKSDLLIHTGYSPHKITDVIERLLEFSSNFMANQVFLAVAAKSEGSPADLSKGVKAASKYADTELGIKSLSITEGSGLSRQNKISAINMAKILEAFYPYYHLMKNKNGMYFKTGTLDGVSARAGYMESESGEMLRFVILINSKGKNADSVLKMLRESVIR